MRLTDEQNAVVTTVKEDCPVVVVEAGAGAGKTSTLVACAEALRGKSGLYMTYNKAIANEAKHKMPASTRVSTVHSMAYHAMTKVQRERFRSSNPRQPASEVAKMLDLPTFAVGKDRTLAPTAVASIIKQTIKKFCESGDTEITEHHMPFIPGTPDGEIKKGTVHRQIARELIVPHAKTMWEDLLQPRGWVPFTYHTYLKLYELSRPKIAADFVMLDEAQDANPVIASILARQDHVQRILVGDSAQAINGWNGAVDALKRFLEAYPNNSTHLYLSQSWRFGQEVADLANVYLAAYGTELRLRGNPNIHTTVEPRSDRDVSAILCRTNAGAIGTALDLLEDGKPLYMPGGTHELIALIDGVEALQNGRRSSHRELMVFETYGALLEYLSEDGDAELSRVVDLTKQYNPSILRSSLQRVADKPYGRGETCVSTAHKSKGLEFPSMRVNSDFKPADKEKPLREALGKDEIALRYVTITRAQHHLDPGILEQELMLGEIKDVDVEAMSSATEAREEIELGTTRSPQLSLF